jgi:imidazolonepropionase-like amidohydrolase
MKKFFFLAAVFFTSLLSLGQDTLTYITNVNLVNTSEGKIQKGITVVVEGSTIKQVGRYNPKFKIPDAATVIDGSGKYLMPGMIDGHIHFFQSGGLYTRPDALNLGKFYPYTKDQQWITDNQPDLMRRYLACGITTVIDVGGPFSNYEIKKNNAANRLAPNAYVTGPLISTYLPPNLDEKDPPIIKVNNEEEARALVRKQLPYQPDFIKIWYIVLPGQPAEKTLPIIKATIEESHLHGLKVAVHATEYETAKLAVEAGCDILVHSVDDKLVDAAFLQLLKSKNISYIPTAIVASKYVEVFTQQHRISTHEFKYANPFMLGTLFDLQHLPAKETGLDYLQLRSRLKIPSKEDSTILQNLRLVSSAGINVVAGTDAGNIGTQHAASFYTELQAMQQAGMSNAQILKAATINAARGFGKEEETGSIEKGKLANMLLLPNNPLDSLHFINDIEYVMNRGKWIKRDSLLPVTPEIIAQQQLNAYNARNMDAFLEPYSDSVELYEFPGKLNLTGKENMRKAYSSMFEQVAGLHCKLENRIILGNTVIDHELVTGFGPAAVKAVAVYTIENGKIQKVYFIQ